MRAIIKGTEPQSLTTWKSLASDDWQPEYANLANPEKRDLQHALLAEQFHCCCYCGREIGIEDSHIEHFRPQSEHRALELDYTNLHASCIRASNPETPLHCGHKKGDWFNEHLHISPLQADCEGRFRYLLSGTITPSVGNDTQASAMIEALSLDIEYLANRRQKTLAGMFDEMFLETASDEELQAIIAAIRTPDDGKLSPFSHVIARFAEQLLGNQLSA